MKLSVTQEELEYHFRKVKFNGKIEMLREINSLTNKGLTIEQAIMFIGEEMKEELAEWSKLEKYYER